MMFIINSNTKDHIFHYRTSQSLEYANIQIYMARDSPFALENSVITELLKRNSKASNE